jgi:quercetin dioxygenase-like cupin family protein
MNTSVRVTALALVLFIAAAFAFAQGESLRPAQLIPDELTWTPGPAGRALVAKVAGDSTKAGMYAIRVKFLPGFRVEPHFHPDDRIVTVLSGTVHMGYGEQFDESKMRALPAGSVWTEPANQPHFAWAKDGEVVLQVIGNGPSSTTPVRPRQ